MEQKKSEINNSSNVLDITFEDIIEEILDDDYDIILYNDNITPLNYVIMLLQVVFRFDSKKALIAAKAAEKYGNTKLLRCGKVTAEQFIKQVKKLNEQNNQKLKIEMKKDK